MAGAGSYADSEIGAAACTGNGDLMMRFLPRLLTITFPNAIMKKRDSLKVNRKDPVKGMFLRINSTVKFTKIGRLLPKVTGSHRLFKLDRHHM